MLVLIYIITVMNISWVVGYREQVKKQKIEEVKPIEIKEVGE